MHEAEEDERNSNDMMQARSLNSDVGKSLSEEFVHINHVKQRIDDSIKNGLKLGEPPPKEESNSEGMKKTTDKRGIIPRTTI